MEWIIASVVGLVLFPVVVWLLAIRLPIFIIELGNAQDRSKRTKLATWLLELGLRVSRATDWMLSKNLVPRQLSPLSIGLQSLSNHYYCLGNYELSSALDDKHLLLLQDSPDLAAAAKATMITAVNYMLKGDLTRALQLSEKGTPIIEAAYRNAMKDDVSAMDKIMRAVHGADLVSAMFSRAWILETLRRYEEAEPIRKKALSIAEEQFGMESFGMTPHLSQLGSLYRKQKRFSDAEPLLRRCLAVREKIRSDPDTDPSDKELNTDIQIASASEELGCLLLEQGDVNEAAEYLEKTQMIIDRDLSPDNPMHAEISVTIGLLRIAQGRYEEAKLILENSRSALETKLGMNNPMILPCLETLSLLHRKSGDYQDEESVNARIKQICIQWSILADHTTQDS